jgi:hypothetical protein
MYIYIVCLLVNQAYGDAFVLLLDLAHSAEVLQLGELLIYLVLLAMAAVDSLLTRRSVGDLLQSQVEVLVVLLHLIAAY